MLLVAWIGVLKIMHGLVANQKLQASVEFGSDLANDLQLVNLSGPFLFLKHKVRHMSPVGVDEPVHEREAKKNSRKT